MSYSVYTYAGLGIRVEDFANYLPSEIAATPVSGADAEQCSAFLILDDKTEELFRQSNLKADSWSCPSFDVMLSNGYLDAEVDFRNSCSDLTTRISSDGPNFFFSHSLQADIVSAEHYKVAREEVVIFPCKKLRINVNGKHCEGLALVKGSLKPIVETLATGKNLNMISWMDVRDTVKVPCLKTALNTLLKLHHEVSETYAEDRRMYCAQALELWVYKLVDSYLESRGCYCNVRVQSSYMGDLMNKGMEVGVPYITWDEGLATYGVDGWRDPRSETDDEGCSPPVKLIQARDCLLGPKSSGDWIRLLPQFGG